MQINRISYPSTDQSNRAPVQKKTDPSSDSTNFVKTSELEQILHDQQDTRRLELNKAAELIAQLQWPTQAVIHRIANLLSVPIIRTSS